MATATALIVLAALASSCACGGETETEADVDEKIVGGLGTKIEKYPYQVSIEEVHRHICGGTIVSKILVVTAAHCLQRQRVRPLCVRVGSSLRMQGGRLVPVARRLLHPKRAEDSSKLDYDVAVAVLQEPLRFGAAVQALPLQPSGVHLKAGTVATVTGWGALREGFHSMPARLQQASVSKVSLAECRNLYRGPLADRLSDRMACYAAPGRDACQGDSGGPLAAKGRLVGVTSWGKGCGRAQFPGVYTDIADPEVNDWIVIMIRENKPFERGITRTPSTVSVSTTSATP